MGEKFEIPQDVEIDLMLTERSYIVEHMRVMHNMLLDQQTELAILWVAVMVLAGAYGFDKLRERRG